jgi:hypothetical protein
MFKFIFRFRTGPGRISELRAAADRKNKSIIVNQKLVKDFGWKEAVGKTVTLYDTTRLTIIGVVKDFYINGLWKSSSTFYL